MKLHTGALALLLRVKAVPAAAAAAVPELGAGVGLLVVVPADVVVTARALVQDHVAAGVQWSGLCKRGGIRQTSK